MPAKKSKASGTKKKQMKKVKSKKPELSTPRKKPEASFSSYESWLSIQVKNRIKHPSSGAKAQGSVNPENTFDAWLKKQHAVEKQAAAPSKPVADTYDEWVRKQVADRQSRPEEEKEIEPGSEAVPQ